MVINLSFSKKIKKIRLTSLNISGEFIKADLRRGELFQILS